MITIDVTYLCNSICDYVLWYYENNQVKFKFDFDVITQEEFMNPSEEAHQFAHGDAFVNILDQKLEKKEAQCYLQKILIVDHWLE